MKTVVFDLDGTLADTSGDLIAAANSCFRRLGHGDMLDAVQDRATAFAGGRAMLRLGFARLKQGGEAEIDREFPHFLAFYGDNIDHHTFLYPGARAAIKRLLAAGYAVGICTNKPEGLAENLLTKLDIRHLFASLIGADTLSVRKPDAAPLFAAVERAGGERSRALLVGDTITDRDCARAAGVPCLMVTFGPDGHGVERFAPEGLLHDYASLEGEVRALIG